MFLQEEIVDETDEYVDVHNRYDLSSSVNELCFGLLEMNLESGLFPYYSQEADQVEDWNVCFVVMVLPSLSIPTYFCCHYAITTPFHPDLFGEQSEAHCCMVHRHGEACVVFELNVVDQIYGI